MKNIFSISIVLIIFSTSAFAATECVDFESTFQANFDCAKKSKPYQDVCQKLYDRALKLNEQKKSWFDESQTAKKELKDYIAKTNKFFVEDKFEAAILNTNNTADRVFCNLYDRPSIHQKQCPPQPSPSPGSAEEIAQKHKGDPEYTGLRYRYRSLKTFLTGALSQKSNALTLFLKDIDETHSVDHSSTHFSKERDSTQEKLERNIVRLEVKDRFHYEEIRMLQCINEKIHFLNLPDSNSQPSNSTKRGHQAK